MKAVIVQQDKRVKVEEKPVPNIGRSEVLLKVIAAGLNPTDWKHIESFSKPGDISGCDFVGEVVKLGQDVPASEFQQGELRWGFVRGGISGERGAFAEYVAVDWDLTSVVPKNITPQQAAAIPIPFMTAVQALFLKLKIQEPPHKANGEWIIIWRATSVGRYAIQLAKLSGLKVATTASEANWKKLKSYGADVLVDYKDPDVVKKLKEATNNSIQFGIDCVSINGSSIQQAQQSFGSSGGELITVGFDLGEAARPDVKTKPTLAYTLLGVDQPWGKDQVFRASPEDRALYIRWAKLATKLFGEGWIKPLEVDIVGNLDTETVQKGLDLLKSGEHGNKLVLNVGQSG